MKISTFIVLIALTVSCTKKEKSIIFQDCECSKINLANGVRLTDSLNHFSIIVPDSSWSPMRVLTETENGLTVGENVNGIRLFNINETEYSGTFDWEAEQESVYEDFNVLEIGDINFKERKCRWNLVHFPNDTPEMYTLYLSIVDTVEKKIFTLNVTVEKGDNFKSRICEMESILESFELTD